MTQTPSDTAPEAARVQIEVLRGMTPERRLQIALSLSQMTMEMATEGIRRALGRGASDVDVAVRFVEVHYGRELADAFRHRLESGDGDPDGDRA